MTQLQEIPPRPVSRAADATCAVRHYLRHAQASNTRRTYAVQWQAFTVWCDRRGISALPAEPEVVAEYLAQRAHAGAAVASLNVMLASLRFAHATAELPLRLDNPVLKLVMKGIRRHNLRPQRQAEPLTGSLLRDVLSRATQTTEGLRDATLLALLYVFGLRAAEVVALDWQEPGEGRGWLRVLPDRAEVGLIGSKASPGEVERVVVPIADNPLAMGTLAGWIAHARITPSEPLLRPMTRGGLLAAGRLHVGSVGCIVKRAMARHFQRAGLSREAALARAEAFSGHSGRVGMCVSATEAGVSHQHLAALVRHRSLAMVKRYAEQADRFKCAPHRMPGVGV